MGIIVHNTLNLFLSLEVHISSNPIKKTGNAKIIVYGLGRNRKPVNRSSNPIPVTIVCFVFGFILFHY